VLESFGCASQMIRSSSFFPYSTLSNSCGDGGYGT
jgi:hypothetical protein